MPLIKPTISEVKAQQASDEGLLNPIRANRDAVVAPEERSTTNLATELGPMSIKERRRGGDYGFGAAANDIAGGFVKGLALLPDAAINAIARSTEKQQGLEEGPLGRDIVNRALRSGHYYDEEWLAGVLLSMHTEVPY